MFRSLSIVLILIGITGCGILMHRKVECRPLDPEMYSFIRHHKVPKVIVYESSFGRNRSFILNSNHEYHTDFYYSDTGCGCVDVVVQKAYSLQGDSIIIISRSSYIEQGQSSIYSGVYFHWDGLKNGFGGKDSTSLDEGLDRRQYTFYQPDSVFQIESAVLVEKLGLVSFALRSGETWQLKDAEVDMSFTPFIEQTVYSCPGKRPNILDPLLNGDGTVSAGYNFQYQSK